jgi:hypothetical protein
MQGNRVLVQQVMPGNGVSVLNLSALALGSYWVVFECNGERLATRITRL